MSNEYQDSEVLISLVEQKPVLWDKSLDLYKNRTATQAAWIEVMEALNPEFETMEEEKRQADTKLIIQRWTHIRDNFHRSCKKIRNRLRNGGKTARPYIYSKQLSFLKKVLDPDSVSSIIENDSENEGFEICSVEICDPAPKRILKRPMRNDSENEGSEICSVEICDPAPKRIPKRLMRNDMNSVDTEMMKFVDCFSHQEPTNRHLSFLNSILPTLDSFDDNEVIEFQMGVLQLLKNIKSSRQSQQ